MHSKVLHVLLSSMDFSSLELRIFKSTGTTFNGVVATPLLVDDYIPVEEETIKVGNREVSSNSKTKGKAHKLPFYLGSKRRY